LDESSLSEQEAIRFVRELQSIDLPKFRVVGRIVRYEQSDRNSMKDTKQRIVSSLSSQLFGCDNDLAWAYAKLGNINEVKNILADLLKINEQSHKSETEIASVYLSLGEKDKAMEWLEKAYDRHAGYLLGIMYDSTFDDFRSDPRFKALLKKIGFPDVG
jgi:tetratricopeptide (TPR) repeat protein